MLKTQRRRRHRPSRPYGFVDLLADSGSLDPAIRQLAFKRFESLVAKADQLPADKRLTYLERSTLTRSFAMWGLCDPPQRRLWA
jgi:hypothetical protein